MRLFVLARKDLLRQARSAFAIAMMFGAPLLVTGLMYAAFGAVAGGGAPAPTRVVVVQPTLAGAPLRGPRLAEFLRSPGYATLFEVDELDDAEAAVARVDAGRAAVAVVVPRDLALVTAAPGATATIVLTADPTLTVGPALAHDAVQRYADTVSGAAIAARVAAARAVAAGEGADAARAAGAAATAYGAWLQRSEARVAPGSAAPPAGPTDAGSNGSANASAGLGRTLGMVMAGMTIFFVFFTGANMAASVVREQEEGTLHRLLATTTGSATILGGKLLSILVVLVVQATVLVVVSSFLFGIAWGGALPMAVAIVTLALAAAAFGLFVMGFVSSSRQTGPVLGIVLTLTGVAGGLMTTGFTALPPAFAALRRFTPQGWVLDLWDRVLAGSSPGAVAGPTLASLAFALVLFAAGLPLLRRRLARQGR